MTDDRKIYVVLIITAIFVLAVLLHVTLGILCAVPERAYVEDGNIILATKIGKPVIIPEAEVIYLESRPAEDTGGFIRTNGLSMGNCHAGHFKNKNTGRKYYLFLSGTGNRRVFSFQDVICEVDFNQ